LATVNSITLPRTELLESTAGDLRFAFSRGEAGQNGCVVEVAFTTFYNPLLWLDTKLLAGLYSLALVRASEPPGEG
jgi:hypothetical protein